MSCEIAVTQPEPVRHSISRHLFKATERLVSHPPAALRVESVGETICDRIDIRTDMQAPDIGIVSDINDDVDLFFGYDLNEATQKFGGAGPAGYYGVVGRIHAIILRGAKCWRPEIQQSGRNQTMKVADFAFVCLSIEKAEDGAGDKFRIDQFIAATAITRQTRSEQG
jgi:hypothetical protein